MSLCADCGVEEVEAGSLCPTCGLDEDDWGDEDDEEEGYMLDESGFDDDDIDWWGES